MTALEILNKTNEEQHMSDWSYIDESINVYDGKLQPILDAMELYAEQKVKEALQVANDLKEGK